MANKRIKELNSTASVKDLANGTFAPLDGSNGTKKFPAELIGAGVINVNDIPLDDPDYIEAVWQSGARLRRHYGVTDYVYSPSYKQIQDGIEYEYTCIDTQHGVIKALDISNTGTPPAAVFSISFTDYPIADL